MIAAIVGTAIGLIAVHAPARTSAALSVPTTQPAAVVTPGTARTPSTTQDLRATPPGGGSVLAGNVVAIDPGHNGGNSGDPAYINSPVWNGRQTETCDTTGTETDGGYSEATFNIEVARMLAVDLEAKGAKVVLTRTSNTGVGPCVTQRAAIGNNAHANVAVSIHADGGPPSGRGFTVLEPVADGVNDAIITPSAVFGSAVRSAFLAASVEPISNYYGTNGIQARDDLGGLNLSTVPKVLVECANMRNATDAALVTSSAWQHKVAAALAAAITQFLSHAG
jgi:N-acetylmuramoyl-L-alanine amidase